MTRTIRVAGVQMDPKIGDVAGNLDRCLAALDCVIRSKSISRKRSDADQFSASGVIGDRHGRFRPR